MDRSFKQFLALPVTRDFVNVLVWKVGLVVGSTPSPSSALPSLAQFARSVIINSRIQPSTLFGAMVYLERLGSRFTQLVASHECAPHRVLLASLILAGKFLNDSSPKNRHWSSYSRLFSIKDVNLMELQFLTHLDFNLTITSPQLLNQYQSFMHLPHSPPSSPKSIKPPHFFMCYIPSLNPIQPPPQINLKSSSKARQSPLKLKPKLNRPSHPYLLHP